MTSRDSTRSASLRFELPGISVGLRRFRPGQTLLWGHKVPARLCVILGGEMIESRARGDLRYSTAHVVYKPPEDRPHLRFGPTGLKTLTLVLDSKRLATLGQAGASVESAFSTQSASCAALGVRIYRELQEEDELAHFALEGLILELLAKTWRTVTNSPDTGIPAWLRRVRRRLEDEAELGLTHTELAATAGVHPVHLAQRFRACYGMSIGRFVRSVRVRRAAARLAETEAPLAEIALSAGFYDQAHFSKVFKRATGLTPRQYRRSLSPKGVQKA